MLAIWCFTVLIINQASISPHFKSNAPGLQFIPSETAADRKSTLFPLQSPFPDFMQDAWYQDAISALATDGVVSGCDCLFRPDDVLTYGQFATLLTRFVDAKTVTMPDGMPIKTIGLIKTSSLLFPTAGLMMLCR